MASQSCSVLVDAWVFGYIDFGESHGTLGRPGDAASATGQTLPIRLGGRAFDARLFELALDAIPPVGVSDARRSWHGLAGVLDPWPHQGTSIILGQIGFMENFTVTFGPDHFAVEPGNAFSQRFAPVPG